MSVSFSSATTLVEVSAFFLRTCMGIILLGAFCTMINAHWVFVNPLHTCRQRIFFKFLAYEFFYITETWFVLRIDKCKRLSSSACDPVCGLVQIPCIERNAYAAARALDANLYSSFTDGMHRVSFDRVIDVMKETGNDLPSLYKETGEGGLAKDYHPM